MLRAGTIINLTKISANEIKLLIEKFQEDNTVSTS
jgi:hypothetical protein